MTVKSVIITGDDYKTANQGLDLLEKIIWISEQDLYEEIAMNYIQSLLEHEGHLVLDLKEMTPFEGESEDRLWWLKQLSILSFKKFMKRKEQK